MSGFVGLQSYSPDFARALTAAGSIQSNALARRAQQEELDSAGRFRALLPQVVEGLGSADPSIRANALARLAATSQGFGMAAPQLMRQGMAAEYMAATGGAPAAGAPGAGAAPQAAAGAAGDWNTMLRGSESSFRNDAQPRFPPGHPQAGELQSSAYGQGQFIDGTWLRFAEANPQLFRGMTRAQVLAARGNEGLARQAVDWYARVNARTLRDAGFQVNGQTLALAHQFGAGGAQALLQAPADAPIEAIFPPSADGRPHPVIRANPDIAGRTVGQVVQRRTARFANARNVPTLEAPPGATATDMPPPGAAFPATPGAAGGGAPAPGVASAGDAAAGLRARPTGRILPPHLEWAADRDRLRVVHAMARAGNPAAEADLQALNTFLTQDVPLVEVEGPDGRRVRVPQDQAVGTTVPLPENAQADLRREFDGLPQVRAFNEIQNAAQNFVRTFGRTGSPESDRNLVEAYARVMSPRLAMGDDGTARIVQDQGVVDRIIAWGSGLLSQGSLDTNVRQQMLAEVRDRYDQSRQDVETASRRIARQAQGWNIPLDRVIDLPAAPQFPGGATQQQTGTPPPPPPDVTPNMIGAELNRMVREGTLTLDDARRRAVAAGLDPNTVSGGAQ